MIGPFPEKTPLNARVTGVIKKEDYRVEKVIYESVPGYYVTAALFLPGKRKGKAPAGIYVSGHTVNGFRSETYQHIIINLVKKGFVVLAFDPMGRENDCSIMMKKRVNPVLVPLQNIPIPEHNVIFPDIPPPNTSSGMASER